MAIIGKNIDTCVEILQKGNLIAMPTETVYGLAGNAFDVQAIAKIFQVKNRPYFDPLIVHTYSLEKVQDFISEFPPVAQRLATHFWPGALTLLLPKKDNIPDLVTSGLPNVAIRIPNHLLALQLLKKLDFPLAAPSANPFGYISPTTPQHVQEQLGNKIEYILDGGACNIGIESTIVGFENGIPTVYRLGGISIEQIEAIIGKVQVLGHSSSNPKAPGMLQSHYAPRKPLFIQNFNEVLKKYQPEEIGILGFNNFFVEIPKENQFILSENQDFTESTQNLFGAMRHLDSMNIKVIFAELLPEKDLGRAINDRLRRAAVANEI
jgi:L-threonylcarbamoyladenylate synthase